MICLSVDSLSHTHSDISLSFNHIPDHGPITRLHNRRCQWPIYYCHVVNLLTLGRFLFLEQRKVRASRFTRFDPIVDVELNNTLWMKGRIHAFGLLSMSGGYVSVVNGDGFSLSLPRFLFFSLSNIFSQDLASQVSSCTSITSFTTVLLCSGSSIDLCMLYLAGFTARE